MDIETKLNEFRAVVGFVCPAEFRAVVGFVCPAEFWPALGYEGDARYVAVYWEACGDEAAWCDGRSSFVGADWPAYIKLIDRNFPLGHPARWLVVDRRTEWGWLAPADEAWAVLRMQHPDSELPAATMTVEELLAALDAAAAQVNLARRNGRELDVAQALARQHERDVALAAALRGRAAA